MPEADVKVALEKNWEAPRVPASHKAFRKPDRAVLEARIARMPSPYDQPPPGRDFNLAPLDPAAEAKRKKDKERREAKGVRAYTLCL